jgi:hypothetical protein
MYANREQRANVAPHLCGDWRLDSASIPRGGNAVTDTVAERRRSDRMQFDAGDRALPTGLEQGSH